MSAAFLRKYNTAITAGTAQSVKIPMIKRGVVDFAVGADWTPATGDVKVSKDGGAAANIATLPAAVAMGNGAYWEFVFSNSELSCGTLVVTIADSATKAVEDQAFIIETFGNASAFYAWDMSLANLPANLTQILGTALTETAGQIAAAFKKFFNIATPAATMDHLILVDTATTVTNQLTAAAVATGVWQDTTAGDFTAANSIGKSVLNGVALGTGLTINGYTGNTPQTGDSYARIGANGISLSAIPDLAGVTTLLSRLSAARAGYLDNINNAALATTAAQTGDSYARLGAPAGASVSADIAAAKVDTAAIKLVTVKLDSMITFGVGSPSDYAFNITAMENAPSGSGASAATIAAAVWDEARSGHVSAGTFGHGVIVDVIATDAVDANALKADAVTEIQSGLSTLTAAGVRTAVGLGSANLDTQLAAIPTAIQNADALLNRDMSVGTDSGSPTVRTPRQAFRFLRNKWSIAAGTLTVTKEDDTTASWTGAVAGTAGADPVTSVDPA